jgi:hypothetical protein
MIGHHHFYSVDNGFKETINWLLVMGRNTIVNINPIVLGVALLKSKYLTNAKSMKIEIIHYL